MVRIGVGALLTLAAAFARPLPAQTTRPAEDGLVIVANPDVPSDSLAQADVRRIFLLRRQFWSDGHRIAPVNLPATSALRNRFSTAVLGRRTRAFSAYWNDLYFHGTSPPPVVQSEQAVILYVARTPGAVGYVSTAALHEAGDSAGVKVLLAVQP